MASRSTWTGTLSFGMVVIPVRLYTTVSKEDDLDLHLVRREDGSRVEWRRFAVADGKQVDYSDLARAYELADGRVVILSEADEQAAYGEASKNAEILGFTGAVPPTAAHESEYLVKPEPGGDRAYELLAGAMLRSGKAAEVRFSLREREARALLHATEDGYLVLERLHWAARVRLPDFAAPRAGVTRAEEAMADMLVVQMSREFDWQATADPVKGQLEQVVRSKIDGGEVTGVPAARSVPAATTGADLMAALAKSVADAKAAKAPAPRTRAPRTRKAAA